jgi:hypothetical protein
MSMTSTLTPAEFQSRLERYLYERSEEWRAVRVGEKEVSEQAEIVRRYADLFTREQLDALREAEGGTVGEDHELLYRLRKTCESALISAQLAEREDELENRQLAERVTFDGEEMPLRSAQGRGEGHLVARALARAAGGCGSVGVELRRLARTVVREAAR